MKWLIKKLGSLVFTAVILIALMAMLVVSTSLESVHGTAFVQKTVYQTRWFDLFLSLLWINIFCSALLRLPFKKKHIGFLITHLGILGLLIGALLSRIFGVDGQILLYELESSDQLKLGAYRLQAVLADQKKLSFDIHKPGERLDLGTSEPQVFVHKVYDHAVESAVVKEGSDNDPLRRGLKVRLSSKTMGLDQELWLMESGSDEPHSDTKTIGSLTVSMRLKATDKTESPILLITDKAGKELTRIDLSGKPGSEIPLGEELKIVNLRYYPYARVMENKLVNGDGGKRNPAVEFEVVNGAGEKERFIKFALYPDFESMHQIAGGKHFDLKSELRVPQSLAGEPGPDSGASLVFEFTPDGKWSYITSSHHGDPAKGDVEINKDTPGGWMDISFRVEETLFRARSSVEIVNSTDQRKGSLAVELLIKSEGKDYFKWVTEEHDTRISAPAGAVSFRLAPETRQLPFVLTLKDFKKGIYPGTTMASSFESDVKLQDPKEHIAVEKTISMNRPLDYKGYRIFQTSYIENPGYGEASVFTVAKNPGTALIYISSCIIFIGAFLQFFVRTKNK